MGAYYRIQDSSRDASALLDPANWVSRVWYDATVTCTECKGEGWLWVDMDEAACEACKGHGVRNLSSLPRRGVSCCESVQELAAYFAAHAGRLDEDSVVVELEGTPAGEDDFDADAVLILPSAVVSVTPATELPEFAELT